MFCGARFVAKVAGCCCHVNAVPCKDLYPGVADKRRIGAIYGGAKVTNSYRAYFLIKYKANAIKLVLVSKKRFLCEEEFFGEGLFAGMLGKSIASTEGAPTKQTAEWQRQRPFLSEINEIYNIRVNLNMNGQEGYFLPAAGSHITYPPVASVITPTHAFITIITIITKFLP